jgi:hypothetical protein
MSFHIDSRFRLLSGALLYRRLVDFLAVLIRETTMKNWKALVSHPKYSRSIDIEWTGSLFHFLIKEPTKPLLPGNNILNIGIPYLWHRLGFYTFWTPSKDLIALCFDLPQSLIQALSTSLLDSEAQFQLHDPFSIHTLLVERVITCYDTSLWAWRDVIRELERV